MVRYCISFLGADGAGAADAGAGAAEDSAGLAEDGGGAAEDGAGVDGEPVQALNMSRIARPMQAMGRELRFILNPPFNLYFHRFRFTHQQVPAFAPFP
jgi:hypothetical protein